MFYLLENRRDELSEQLLESQDKTHAHNRSRVYSFFCDPNALGENLYTIIKFGLVQYVSYFVMRICSFTQHWQIMTCHNFVYKIADDSEDTMCFVGVDLGAFRSLWRWGIQVELRVSVFFTFFGCRN